MIRTAVCFSLLSALCCAAAAQNRFQGITIPDQSGRIVTVLGPIEPARLGQTLMHEHLFIDFWLPLDEPDRWQKLEVRRPQTPEELAIWNTPFSVADRTRLLPYFFHNRDAFTLNDMPAAISEVKAYQALGGQTIVDVTSRGLNPQPEKVRQVAKSTGINLVMGTGYYRRAWHPADMDRRSLDDLTASMVRDIVEGFGETGIRAGIIGEIPADHLVFTPNESNIVRVLRAAARASRLTGAAISLHSDFENMLNLHASLDILEQEGADLSRVVMGHMATLAAADVDFLESLLARGVYLQFDVLGNPWEMALSNRPMVEAIEALILRGHSRRLLVAHDVCTKFQLKQNGGYGFTFVHTILLPYLRQQGVSEKAIENILINNPRQVLTFTKAGVLLAR